MTGEAIAFLIGFTTGIILLILVLYVFIGKPRRDKQDADAKNTTSAGTEKDTVCVKGAKEGDNGPGLPKPPV